MIFRLNFGNYCDGRQPPTKHYSAGDEIESDINLAERFRIRDHSRRLWKFTRIDTDDLADDLTIEDDDEEDFAGAKV